MDSGMSYDNYLVKMSGDASKMLYAFELAIHLDLAMRSELIP